MKRTRDANVFDLSDVSRFSGNFPKFQMPSCVGVFSLNEQREYVHDKSQLKYLALPTYDQKTQWDVNYNLRNNLDSVTLKDENEISSRMLDDLLRWILEETRKKRELKFGFVCFRGLLTLLMATPYEYRESWSILASKLNDTIYLWELKDRSAPQNAFQKEAAVWGYKFEQYLCSERRNEPPNPEAPLNTNAELCCVLRTNLSGHCLLYGAEVDAFNGKSEAEFTTLEYFVELKTSRSIENQRQDQNFRKFKLLKWWAQSFLVGIPSILCGFRDDKGVVSRLERFEVKKLPNMAKDYWNGAVCMNFCSQLLSFVRDKLSDCKPLEHYKFDYDPRYGTVMFSAADRNSLNRKLLPDWYTDEIKRLLRD